MEKVNVADYLPEKSRVLISNQKQLLQQAVSKTGSQYKLAKYMGVYQSTVRSWLLCNSRLTSEKLNTIKKLLEEADVKNIKFETHKRTPVKISAIQISSEFAWFTGIRDGDRDEDKYSVGVGTTDSEIAIEFKNTLLKLFNLEENELYCIVTSPNQELSKTEKENIQETYSKELGLPKEIIRVKPRGKNERNKKYHTAVRYYNKLLKDIISNIENDFAKIIKNSSEQVQGSYVAGLIDSEGTVKDSGRIVIEMRPKSYMQLKLASEILENLKIKYNFVEDKKYNLVRLTIYPNSLILKFCNPVHKRKRAKLYNVLGMGQGFPLQAYLSGGSRGLRRPLRNRNN